MDSFCHSELKGAAMEIAEAIVRVVIIIPAFAVAGFWTMAGLALISTQVRDLLRSRGEDE